jgi:hypothetical protein
MPHKRRDVAIGRERITRTRHNQDRVFAQVRELDHSTLRSGAEVFHEGGRIRSRCQPRAVQKDELEGPACRFNCNRRSFQSERGKRQVSQQTDEEGAEGGVFLPTTQDFRAVIVALANSYLFNS